MNVFKLEVEDTRRSTFECHNCYINRVSLLLMSNLIFNKYSPKELTPIIIVSREICTFPSLFTSKQWLSLRNIYSYKKLKENDDFPVQKNCFHFYFIFILKTIL